MNSRAGARFTRNQTIRTSPSGRNILISGTGRFSAEGR